MPLSLRRVGVIAGNRVQVRPEQGKARFDSLTTPVLANGVCFRQMLGLVRRLGRLQAILDKVVCNASPLQIDAVRLLLRFGNCDVSDRNVGINFVDDIARHPEIGWFRRLSPALFRNVFWYEYRAQRWLSGLHRG